MLDLCNQPHEQTARHAHRYVDVDSKVIHACLHQMIAPHHFELARGRADLSPTPTLNSTRDQAPKMSGSISRPDPSSVPFLSVGPARDEAHFHLPWNPEFPRTGPNSHGRG